ncbi:MAG: alpha/beta fold hydrolase [Proteobacteria bacterium]|nr:alpha/beta fold hydrolase [Pseudomonadota bacterium]MBU1739460.1 alpha/beta fold hydrolase [Pseudomonadota bacterium]
MGGIKELRIEVADCGVHALLAGEGEGRDVILLHGMKFQAETWKQTGTLEILAGAGFRCLALDMPGFGKSPAAELAPAEVLVSVISQMGMARPVLIGPSMGGRICLEFCLSCPEQVGALVLVGPIGIPENRRRLREIRIPVLAIWGGEDSVSPLEYGQVLEREIPGSRLKVISGAPHPCYLEHGDVFHEEVLDFLKNL